LFGRWNQKQTCQVFTAFFKLKKLQYKNNFGYHHILENSMFINFYFWSMFGRWNQNEHAIFPQLSPGLQKSQKYNFGCHHEMPNNMSTNCQNKHVNYPPVPSHFTKKHVYWLLFWYWRQPCEVSTDFLTYP